MRTSFVFLVRMLVLLCGCQRSTANATEQTRTAAASSSTSQQPAPSLDPARGKDAGLVVEGYLSPHQESNEEDASVPKQFRSTEPSMTRAQREAAGHAGHGQIRFSRDLSRAWVDVRVAGIDASKVTMFHIHCGEPGILGPIIVDFELATNIRENLAGGIFSVELKNEHVAGTVAQARDTARSRASPAAASSRA